MILNGNYFPDTIALEKSRRNGGRNNHNNQNGRNGNNNNNPRPPRQNNQNPPPPKQEPRQVSPEEAAYWSGKKGSKPSYAERQAEKYATKATGEANRREYKAQKRGIKGDTFQEKLDRNVAKNASRADAETFNREAQAQKRGVKNDAHQEKLDRRAANDKSAERHQDHKRKQQQQYQQYDDAKFERSENRKDNKYAKGKNASQRQVARKRDQVNAQNANYVLDQRARDNKNTNSAARYASDAEQREIRHNGNQEKKNQRARHRNENREGSATRNLENEESRQRANNINDQAATTNQTTRADRNNQQTDHKKEDMRYKGQRKINKNSLKEFNYSVKNTIDDSNNSKRAAGRQRKTYKSVAKTEDLRDKRSNEVEREKQRTNRARIDADAQNAKNKEVTNRDNIKNKSLEKKNKFDIDHANNKEDEKQLKHEGRLNRKELKTQKIENGASRVEDFVEHDIQQKEARKAARKRTAAATKEWIKYNTTGVRNVASKVANSKAGQFVKNKAGDAKENLKTRASNYFSEENRIKRGDAVKNATKSAINKIKSFGPFGKKRQQPQPSEESGENSNANNDNNNESSNAS